MDYLVDFLDWNIIHKHFGEYGTYEDVHTSDSNIVLICETCSKKGYNETKYFLTTKEHKNLKEIVGKEREIVNAQMQDIIDRKRREKMNGICTDWVCKKEETKNEKN